MKKETKDEINVPIALRDEKDEINVPVALSVFWDGGTRDKDEINVPIALGEEWRVKRMRLTSEWRSASLGTGEWREEWSVL